MKFAKISETPFCNRTPPVDISVMYHVNHWNKVGCWSCITYTNIWLLWPFFVDKAITASKFSLSSHFCFTSLFQETLINDIYKDPEIFGKEMHDQKMVKSLWGKFKKCNVFIHSLLHIILENVFRRVTRNFSGQGRFLKIRALR